MTRRRWIADEHAGDSAALTGANAAHLARVLRARPGQEFEIAAGERVRLGRVVSVSEERVEFALGVDVEGEPALPVMLYLAVFKFDRMEWAIEKATELGVERIVPLVSGRTDAHLAQAAGKRVERWRRLAHEAAQQSRRLAPPEIAAPVPLRDLLHDSLKAIGNHQSAIINEHVVPRSPSTGDMAQRSVASAELRIVLAETERDRTLGQLLSSRHPSRSEGPAGIAPDIAIAVGPEGGWTSDEFAAFTRAGWQPASLGPRILRAETAAIAALAIVSATLGS